MAALTMTTEIYTTIADHPNYQVSNYGNVKIISTGKLLSIRTKKGDTAAQICTLRIKDDDGKVKEQVHRIAKLVADAFVPNPNNFKYVGLRDGDYRNCRADNIYYKSAPNIQTGENQSVKSTKSSVPHLTEDEAELLRVFRDQKAKEEAVKVKKQRRIDLIRRIAEIKKEMEDIEKELGVPSHHYCEGCGVHEANECKPNCTYQMRRKMEEED